MDTSLPSSQVASLLNKAIFPFQPTLISQIFTFEQQTAKHEFYNSKIEKKKKKNLKKEDKHEIRFKKPINEQYQIRKIVSVKSKMAEEKQHIDCCKKKKKKTSK